MPGRSGSGENQVENPPLLAKFFLNKGGGFRGFWPKIPDFGQKSGVLPLVTAKIPGFEPKRHSILREAPVDSNPSVSDRFVCSWGTVARLP